MIFFCFITQVFGYNPEDLEKLQNSKTCPRCDLSAANFYKTDLQEINLSGAVLHFTNLRRANLGGADLSSAMLFGADLFGADLTNTNLKGAKFCNTILPLGSVAIKDC